MCVRPATAPEVSRIRPSQALLPAADRGPPGRSEARCEQVRATTHERFSGTSEKGGHRTR
ncbi:hypothetical protein [Streptomyces sp. NBC_00893]|uniref:hypothetical protein n=1 Tax=Streptomyces sp. NBC_00893 TaxID=2975862 RepID=UPI0022590CA1|nr:hypothetical protein [Streptomyces sp. NBC_00893]MCX4847996.1 hypothetical protein [Streptomyces sp. NBC_00893]